MTEERVTYNGDWLDEIVATKVTVHIEALSVRNVMIRIYNDDGVDVHLNGRDLTEVYDPEGLPVTYGPALTWCTEWSDRFGQRHACMVKHHLPVNNRTFHRCECGAGHKGPAR
jgi:hypothetical protein